MLYNKMYTFFTLGHETTGSLLGITLLIIANHPIVEQKYVSFVVIHLKFFNFSLFFDYHSLCRLVFSKSTPFHQYKKLNFVFKMFH